MELSYVRLALAALAVAGGAATAAVILTSDCVACENQVPLAVLGLLITWSFVGTGLVAWSRRPGNRTGLLMVWVGFAWLPSLLKDAGGPWVASVGELFAALYIVAFGHLILAFPSGRVESRLGRLVIAAGYLDVTVLHLAWMLFDPEEAFAVHESAAAADGISNVERAIGMVLCILGLLVNWRRWRAASPPWRRAAAPVLWSGGVAFVLAILYLINESAGLPLGEAPQWIFWISFLLVPFAFLAGLLRSRLARMGVVDLLVALGGTPAPGELGSALARALHDPSLTVAFWLPADGRYADADGRPVDMPAEGDARVATVVERGGRRVGAIVHDASVLEEPELVEAVSAAAALAVENERLQVELRARLEELAASRARIVEAADAERMRIERNLHDGTQQRLTSISMALGLAQTKLESDAEQAAAILGEARGQLGVALRELRELSQGIHPGVLTERGLGVALSDLAYGATLPVELSVEVETRLPEPVEAAAYYLVAEALANVAKHARASTLHVRVERRNETALVEVRDDGRGGADPGRGTGLRGLVDRISALGGTLQLESQAGRGTTLRAEIPCE